jgi:hypothetical protein
MKQTLGEIIKKIICRNSGISPKFYDHVYGDEDILNTTDIFTRKERINNLLLEKKAQEAIADYDTTKTT